MQKVIFLVFLSISALVGIEKNSMDCSDIPDWVMSKSDREYLCKKNKKGSDDQAVTPSEKSIASTYANTKQKDTIQKGIVHDLDPSGDGFLSLRTKPRGKEIGRLYNGDRLEILDRRGKWYKVRVVDSGQFGWAHSHWIQKTSNSSNSNTATTSSNKVGVVQGLDPNGGRTLLPRKYIYTDNNKGTPISVIGRKDCRVYYPFHPVPPGMTVKYNGECVSGFARDGKATIIFYSKGKEDSHATVSFGYWNDPGAPLGAPFGRPYKWVFSDGEVWKGKLGRWYKVQNSYKKQEQIKIENKRRQEIENAKNAKFRNNLKIGDKTTKGYVIDIKGILVKVQTNVTHCTQRNYKGNCMNYISTPEEQWFKRNELYPAK